MQGMKKEEIMTEQEKREWMARCYVCFETADWKPLEDACDECTSAFEDIDQATTPPPTPNGGTKEAAI